MEDCIVRKISVSETLKSIKVNKKVIIRDSIIAPNVIRSTVSRLKKNGYSFVCKTTPEGTEVIRYK